MRFSRKSHKWLGLILAIFLVSFAVSGIVLNHRKALSSVDISRGLLPNDYQYKNWDNGIIKGSISIGDSVLMYGGAGIWLTDKSVSQFNEYNTGLKHGADNRKISNIVQMPNGAVFCAALYDLYRETNNTWTRFEAENINERISDITRKGDSLVVLTRSNVFVSLPPYVSLTKIEFLEPENYQNKVSLFKTLWKIHSGEIFGLAGQLVVDIVGIVFIVLSVTGVIYIFLPKIIRRRRRKKQDVKAEVKLFRTSIRWHNKLGATFFILAVIITFTGTFLRPPLMIAIIRMSTPPIPFSTMDSENAWEDKLRSIRYDSRINKWLLSTSAGFHQLSHLKDVPVKMSQTPPISPMGINVFNPLGDGKWVVASFSGMYIWDVVENKTYDYHTKELYKAAKSARPVSSRAVSGFSSNTAYGDVIFEYSNGAVSDKQYPEMQYPEMPEYLSHFPMSLWNIALEIHVGRMYKGFIANNSFLFIFLSGILSTMIVITGYIMHRKRKR